MLVPARFVVPSATVAAIVLTACGGGVTTSTPNDTCSNGSTCPPACTSGASCSGQGDDAGPDAGSSSTGEDASTAFDADYPEGSVPPASATFNGE